MNENVDTKELQTLMAKLWTKIEPRLITQELSRQEIEEIMILVKKVPVLVAEGRSPKEIEEIIEILNI